MSRVLGRLLIAAGSLLLLSIGAIASSHPRTAQWRELAFVLLATAVISYGLAERCGWLNGYYEFDLNPDAPSARSQSDRESVRAALIVGAIFALDFAYIGLTGGLASPFFFVLFQPITLLTLRYGVRAGLIASFALALAFLWGPDYRAWPFTASHTAAAISFPMMALFASAITTRLRNASKALSRRLTDLDSLLDVSHMLETALDLKTTVDLILLNAPTSVPFTRCAVYVLDPGGDVLRLCDQVPRLCDDVLAPAITVGDRRRDKAHYVGDAVLSFDREQPADAVGVVLSPDTPVFFDPAAVSVAYAPMRSVDGVVGLLCFARDRALGTFSRHECALLGKYAAHVGLNLQQALYRDRLEHLAFQDTMTGLANYRYFERRLAEELSRCTRYGHPLTVIMLDIDYFKRFNDTWGHKAGDALLGQFGVVLRNTLRDTDIPARYGGEEFVVVCPETSADRAAQISERLRDAIAANIFTLPGKRSNETATAHVTASVGYATFPNDAYTGDLLVRLADKALYAAKASGRNRTVHGEAETLAVSEAEAELPSAVSG